MFVARFEKKKNNSSAKKIFFLGREKSSLSVEIKHFLGRE